MSSSYRNITPALLHQLVALMELAGRVGGAELAFGCGDLHLCLEPLHRSAGHDRVGVVEIDEVAAGQIDTLRLTLSDEHSDLGFKFECGG